MAVTTDHTEGMPDSAALAELQQTLLEWYARQGRDLPWRRTRDGYAVLVAEVMLQQTQVERVLPKYREFLERFGTFKALAEASRGEVIRAWSPLGYNRRAVRLQDAARQVVERWGGQLPRDLKSLRSLPGVGPYTAAAVACFALGQDVVVLDTNVRRVLGRVFSGPEPPHLRDLERIAEQALPAGHGWGWHQALMDVGATLCGVVRPQCLLCPLRPWCRAAPALQDGSRQLAETPARYRAAQAPFKGSNRYYRGRVVELLRGLEDGRRLSLDQLRLAVKPGLAPADMEWLRKLVRELEADGLVKLELVAERSSPTVWVSLP